MAALDASATDKRAIDVASIGASDADCAATAGGGLQADRCWRAEGAAFIDQHFKVGLAGSDVGQAGGHLRLADIVLISRQSDGGQDSDDGDDDHQFDEREALHVLLHG